MTLEYARGRLILDLAVPISHASRETGSFYILKIMSWPEKTGYLWDVGLLRDLMAGSMCVD